MSYRIGQGFDVHARSDDPTRPLVLGGVEFEDCAGLVGHSDGDAVAHACTDALLGAAGLGDIGQRFPDTAAETEGADSVQLLHTVVAEMAEAGWTPVNIDVSVVCNDPKIAPAREAMQQRLSEAVGAPVSVKGRRPEGLGALGRDEGLAVFAVALVQSL